MKGQGVYVPQLGSMYKLMAATLQSAKLLSIALLHLCISECRHLYHKILTLVRASLFVIKRISLAYATLYIVFCDPNIHKQPRSMQFCSMREFIMHVSSVLAL